MFTGTWFSKRITKIIRYHYRREERSWKVTLCLLKWSVFTFCYILCKQVVVKQFRSKLGVEKLEGKVVWWEKNEDVNREKCFLINYSNCWGLICRREELWRILWETYLKVCLLCLQHIFKLGIDRKLTLILLMLPSDDLWAN